MKKNGTQIIVSRSHAGDVQKVVQASLGEETKVEPAGGAGMLLYDICYCMLPKMCILCDSHLLSRV